MIPTPTSPVSQKSTSQDSRNTHSTPKQAYNATMGRRIRWAVLSVPLILIVITASTRYITHPGALDVLSSPELASIWSMGVDWTSHQPHLHPRQDPSQANPSTTASIPSSLPAPAATAQPLPTVPSSPPPIPTPFPQPWQELSKNFSSVSCYNFFQNTTTLPPFRQCRPFSLLLQSSAEFSEAQTNLTLTNNIIWGTCNTSIDMDQCDANMLGFEEELQQKCEKDLLDGNTKAVETLMGLQAYSVMHETGCLVDPTTNSYCFLDAVRNTNPTDLYYYLLPLGGTLPKSSRSTCSACTRSLLSIYSASLDDSTENNSGLRETYNAAAQLAITDCGQSYASLSDNADANAALHLRSTLSTAILLLLGVALSWLVHV